MRFKLFLVSFGLIVVSFLGADLYLARSIDRQLTANIRDDLIVRLELVEREVSSHPAPLDDIPAWDALADDLERHAHVRITIIRDDGAVIGDSDVDTADVPRLGGHAGRPEVAEALAHGRGASMRWSDTVRRRFMYVAIPFRHDGAVAGVVRAAMPLADVDAAIERTRRVMFLATAVALAFAALLSSISAQWMAKTVRSITAAARRMAAGDLAVRTRVPGTDEAAELGAALDQLAESLQRAIEDLRGERDVLGGILDGMHEGVLLLDDQGRILRLNPALRSMFLLGSDAIGRPLLEVVRNAELKELLDAARAGSQTGEIEVTGIKPRRLRVHAAPLAGHEDWRLAVFVDVTEIRRLEAMRRDFVANVSHELRTPVTSVRSAAETLNSGAVEDPAAARRFLDIIVRNAERLQSLIEDLLDLSRIEAREFRLRAEPIAIEPFVAQICSLHRERAESRGVRLRVEVVNGASTVQADRRALEQVLTNLIDNAIKYCPGADVTVRAEVAEKEVRLSVTDTGAGIEEKHLPRLFERFYRVDAGRARDVGGTGLGLSIVKHLVEAMGGTIEVKSALGQGTSFIVTFPRQPARRVNSAESS